MDGLEEPYRTTITRRFVRGETPTEIARALEIPKKTVYTRIDRPSGPAILAGWRVREIAGAPKIIDVVIEGISMTIAQRHEFASVTRRGGIEELVQMLRAQTEKRSEAG